MKRIAIVEDDPALQDVLQIILPPEEYYVETYANAAPVESKLVEMPDLFILDWRLGDGTDGLQLCKKLKADPETKHIPVIMISAMPNISKAAKEAGADGALEKPFRIKAVRDCVRKYLNQQG
jgi:DNA-binding response OmpR family regulator